MVLALAPALGRAEEPSLLPSERWRRAWAQLAEEPDATRVQAAVRAHAARDNLDATLSRSRWAHALPHRLDVQVQRHDLEDWRSTFVGDELAGSYTDRTGSGSRLMWRVQAEWDLSRLVFNPDGNPLARIAEDRRQRIERLVDEVTKLYHERRRLQVAFLLGPPGSLVEQAAAWTTIAELGARIDAVTGGLLARAAVRWWEAVPAAQNLHQTSTTGQTGTRRGAEDVNAMGKLP